MTKENNQLHKDLIKAADLRDERDRKAQLAFRRYQNEIADLKFLNKQLVTRVDQEQRKSDAERFRLENIMNLVGATVGKEIDSKITRIKFEQRLADQVQRIDLDSSEHQPSLEVRDQTYPPPCPVDPMVGDMVKLVEAKVWHLEQSQSLLKKQNLDLDGEVSGMRES